MLPLSSTIVRPHVVIGRALRTTSGWVTIMNAPILLIELAHQTDHFVCRLLRDWSLIPHMMAGC
jgi:hypothetical protein